MATPNQQRSRYPRPLKATHSFTASGEAAPQVPSGAPTNSSGAAGTGSSCHSSPPSPVGGPASTSSEVTSPIMVVVGGLGKAVCGSPPPTSPNSIGHGRGSMEAGKDQYDTHTESPMEGDGENPRRSTSMDCLSDPDSYTWPRLTSTSEDTESDLSGFSHKRSNSCSSADRLPKTPPLKGSHVSAVHTRTSIEGLNQEVSSALEGKQIMPSQHPDGHRAPIRDLVGRPSIGTLTPPHTLGLTSQSYPLSQSPSPYPPHPSSPSQISHSSSFTESSDTPTGHASTQSRESPGTPDNAHHHPSSPKPSFAREPPDGAERCIIKQELKYTSDHIPKGPDKSKASIVFQGSGSSAFAPLLPQHSLKAIGGVQC